MGENLRPRLCLVGADDPAKTVTKRNTDKVADARHRFGRPFAHERGTNFLRHPEPVLSRWHRKADFMNYNPHKERPKP